jgi:hypothetical protein
MNVNIQKPNDNIVYPIDNNVVLSNPYPMGVPAEVALEIQNHKTEEKIRKSRLCLNFLPGFRGKEKKQQFIIKVYGILCI